MPKKDGTLTAEERFAASSKRFEEKAKTKAEQAIQDFHASDGKSKVNYLSSNLNHIMDIYIAYKNLLESDPKTLSLTKTLKTANKDFTAFNANISLASDAKAQKTFKSLLNTFGDVSIKTKSFFKRSGSSGDYTISVKPLGSNTAIVVDATYDPRNGGLSIHHNFSTLQEGLNFFKTLTKSIDAFMDFNFSIYDSSTKENEAKFDSAGTGFNYTLFETISRLSEELKSTEKYNLKVYADDVHGLDDQARAALVSTPTIVNLATQKNMAGPSSPRGRVDDELKKTFKRNEEKSSEIIHGTAITTQKNTKTPPPIPPRPASHPAPSSLKKNDSRGKN